MNIRVTEYSGVRSLLYAEADFAYHKFRLYNFIKSSVVPIFTLIEGSYLIETLKLNFSTLG